MEDPIWRGLASQRYLRGDRGQRWDRPSLPAVAVPAGIVGHRPAAQDRPESLAQPIYLWTGVGGFDIGQSFVPGLPDLVAVELPICTGSGPDEVEVQVREVIYDGPILGSVKLILDAPFCGFGEEQFSRFAFDEPVTFVPGQTCIIRLHSVRPSDAGTFGTPDDYTGRHLFRF